MIVESAPVANQSTQAQGFLRPLGSFEELLWHMDRRHPLHAMLAAQVDGPTTIDQWRDGLERARRRHPLWSAVIAETDDGRPFFQRMCDPAVELCVVEGEFADSWRQAAGHELSVPIDAERGPLVRAMLLHTDASSMLILTAHHSICDGMSLAFAMRDVLQAVSGVVLKNLSLHGSQEEGLGMCSRPHAIRERPSRFDQERPWPEPAAGPTVYRTGSSCACVAVPVVSSRQLSAALTAALMARAKRERTTVHAALVAAAGIAARLHRGYASGRDLNVCSTINNRALVGSPEDSAVFFTACGYAVPDTQLDSVWNIARVSKHMLSLAQSIDGARSVLGAIDSIVQAGLNPYLTGEHGARLFQFDIHISNLGVVPIPGSYGALALRQLWGPGALIGYEGEQTLGVSTINGRLCLLHTSHTALPDFLDEIESILKEACGL